MLIDTPANKNIICSDPSNVGFKHEYIVCKGGRILHNNLYYEISALKHWELKGTTRNF